MILAPMVAARLTRARARLARAQQLSAWAAWQYHCQLTCGGSADYRDRYRQAIGMTEVAWWWVVAWDAASHVERPPPVAECRCCGRRHGLAAWRRLPSGGVLTAGAVYPLRLRHCVCGSTLAVPTWRELDDPDRARRVRVRSRAGIARLEGRSHWAAVWTAARR